MDQINEVLNSPTEEYGNGIFVLGSTGSGKSTLINYLNGTLYHVGVDGIRPYSSTKEIAHQSKTSKSSTQEVRKYLIHDLQVFDCPGFQDNRGEVVDICNQIKIVKQMRSCRKIKVILVLSTPEFYNERSSSIKKNLKAI